MNYPKSMDRCGKLITNQIEVKRSENNTNLFSPQERMLKNKHPSQDRETPMFAKLLNFITAHVLRGYMYVEEGADRGTRSTARSYLPPPPLPPHPDPDTDNTALNKFDKKHDN